MKLDTRDCVQIISTISKTHSTSLILYSSLLDKKLISCSANILLPCTEVTLQANMHCNQNCHCRSNRNKNFINHGSSVVVKCRRGRSLLIMQKREGVRSTQKSQDGHVFRDCTFGVPCYSDRSTQWKSTAQYQVFGWKGVGF